MRGARLLYWAAVAAALFACVDFYFQFPAPAGYGPQFVWLDSGVYRRAQGLFYEASTLGNFCAFFLVMIAVAFTRPREESPVSRKALVAGGAVFFAALVLSYSRASLVNVAVALAVLMWCNRRRVRLARVARAGGGGGALLTWWIFPHFAQMYWLRLSVSAEYLFSRDRRRALRPRGELAHAGRLDCRASLADAVRHRLQDAAVHRFSGQPGGGRQHVPQPAGGDRRGRAGGAAVAQRRDSARGGADVRSARSSACGCCASGPARRCRWRPATC